METPFYRHGNPSSAESSVQLLKSSLTLDFATKKRSCYPSSSSFSSSYSSSATASSVPSFDDVLSSPDVKMLKLATPELDCLLLQQQTISGSGSSVSGPGSVPMNGTQMMTSWYAKSVTEEQEAYARGFVDALLELHGKREASTVAEGTMISADGHDQKMNPPSYGSLDRRRGGDSIYSRSGSEYHPPSFIPVFQPVYPSTQVDCAPLVDTTADLVIDLTRAVHHQDTTTQPFARGPDCYNAKTIARENHHQYNCRFNNPQLTQSFARGPQYSYDSSNLLRDVASPIEVSMPISDSTNIISEKVSHKQKFKRHCTTSSHWSTSTSLAPPSSLLTDTPPISPIDMAQQEAIKLARKRARNRLAATRCRNRKLEKISRLQDRVNELKEQNVQLNRKAFDLRETVTRMKREVDSHVDNGCRLII